MIDAEEVNKRFEFHERKYFFAMNGLMISFLIDAIVVSIVMITNGKFDPGFFLYVPMVATIGFGVLAVYREYDAKKKDKVVGMDYFSWILERVFGKTAK